MSTAMSLAPTNLTEALKFAEMMAKSAMVPTAYKGKAEDVIVALQMGWELGLQPMQALQNIACINGKPSVYGDALLAIVKGSSVCQDVMEKELGTMAQGDAYGYECIAIRKGKSPVRATFTVGDAKKAGLWGKQGPWTTYPKRMLQMRARGFALRDAFPDVLKGIITAEEAGDLPEKEVNAAPLAGQTPPKPPASKKVDKGAGKGAVIDGETGEVLPPADSAPQSSEPQQQTPPAEPNETASSASDPSEWPLYVPGQDAPLGTFPDSEAWLDHYRAIEGNIVASKKLKRATKQQKLRDLKAANEAPVRAKGDDAFFTAWLKGCADILASVDEQPEAAA